MLICSQVSIVESVLGRIWDCTEAGRDFPPHSVVDIDRWEGEYVGIAREGSGICVCSHGDGMGRDDGGLAPGICTQMAYELHTLWHQVTVQQRRGRDIVWLVGLGFASTASCAFRSTISSRCCGCSFASQTHRTEVAPKEVGADGEG